jgi:HlyD family secretion protein
MALEKFRAIATRSDEKERRVGMQAFLMCLCVFGMLPSGCNQKETAPTVEVSVQAVHPEVGSISENINADATLAPLAQAALSPKISAPVKKFFVQRGSKVKEGQLLAVLENSDLEAAALDNKGAYAAAKATYQTATKTQVPEDYQKAQLDLAQAKANLDLNQSIVNSRKQLFAEGAIPGRDLDTSVAALVQAQAAYDTAKKRLEGIEKVGGDAALKAAEGQLTSAEGKFLGAQAQVSYSQIRSPINGVVTDRALFAGETATAGTTLLTIMDTAKLLAKVHIALDQAQRLTVGGAATLQVPEVDERVPATISLISPALDPGSTTVEVWLRVENPKGTYKVGTPVRASIVGRSAQNALLIPSGAVLTAQDGSRSVMVVGADSTAQHRAVTTGLENNGKVQVLSGLTASDMVISKGAYGLDNGTKVKVEAADEGEKPAAGKSGEEK